MTDLKLERLLPGEALAEELVASVEMTIKSLFSIDTRVGMSRIEIGEPIEGDVSAFVSLIDGQIKGAFVMSFPAEAICAMMSKMYGKEFVTINKSVRQGAGELANVVFGKLAASLFLTGFRFELTVPNVIVGEKHSFEITTTGTTLVVPFKTDLGDFVCLFVAYDRASSLAA